MKRSGIFARNLVNGSPAVVLFILRDKVGQLEPVDAGDLLVIIGERQPQMRSKFRFGRSPPQRGHQRLTRRGDAAGHLPQRAGAPIVSAQTVEDGTADPELRKSR